MIARENINIPKLDWEEIHEAQEWIAHTPFGCFEIDYSYDTKKYYVGFDPTDFYEADIVNLESAKAAAQAHWEERLKQCLEVVE